MTDIEREGLLAHSRLPVIQRRISQSLELIKEWRVRCTKPYLAWSTGKDSTLSLWLALQVDPGIEVVYFDAESSLPETQEMLNTLPSSWGFKLRVVKTRPLIDVLVEHGLLNAGVERATMQATVYEPIKRLRHDGYDGVIVGVRADESCGRKMAVSQRGPLFNSKASGMLTCWPLARWSARDVWAVTLANNIPYNKAYDKRLDLPLEERRVSYWAGETQRAFGRYTWLKRYHPELFQKLAEQLPEVKGYV